MALFGRSKSQPADSAPASPAAVEPAVPPPAETVAPQRREVDEHRENLLSSVSSLRPFGVGLLDAAGLTLCESIESDIDLPVYTSASVAGWAVRGSNLVGASPRHPVRLPVVGEVDAGGYRGAPLMPGTAIKVAAGAPVPEGADAVVPLDDAQQFGDEVEFTAEASFQQQLVLAGSRISDGDLLLGNGSVLDPRAIGLLAEVGIDKVLARPKPRVVVASLGAELVDPGAPLERLYQVYDAGTPLVASLARADGAQVFPIGILPSTPSQLRRTITDQLPRADLLLLCAEPDADLTGVLADLGMVDTVEVAMEPAGPVLYALVGDDRTPVLVLPTDTASCYISYQVFGRPLVRRLAGVAPSDRQVTTAPVIKPLVTDPELTSFVLARTTDRGVEPLTAADGPSSLDLVAADVLIVVPAGIGEVGAHADVSCWPLRA